jgi:hypothetical protein
MPPVLELPPVLLELPPVLELLPVVCEAAPVVVSVTTSPVELDVPAIVVVPPLPVTDASLVGASVVGLAPVPVLVTAEVVSEPVACVVVPPSLPHALEPAAMASRTPETRCLRGPGRIGSG